MYIVTPTVEFKYSTPNADIQIESAARVCYRSKSKTVDDCWNFIHTLIANGHETPLEFAAAEFEIVCDRGISHELVRHRLASYCQESTRYVSYEGDGFGVVLPQSIVNNDAERACITETLAHIQSEYARLLAISDKQTARLILPTCLATRIRMTANLREWRHILKLRCAKAAHPQMRMLMGKVGLCLLEFSSCPVFEDLEDLIREAAQVVY